MKVVMITSYPPMQSGIANYSANLKKYMPDLTIYSWNHSGLFNRLIQPIIKFFELRRLFKQYDIVHVQYHLAEYMPLFLPLLFFMPRHAGIVLTCHEDYANLPAPVRWFHNIFYLVADLILVHTEEHRRILPKYLNVRKINFGVESKPPVSNRTEYILMPGFINPWKGQHILIEALKILKDRHGFLPKVLIAGHPHDKKYCDTMVQKTIQDGLHVTWARGFIPNDEYLKNIQTAKLVVLPYTRITMSAVLSDVLGCATPAILSDLPAFNEFVPGGIFFKTGDPESLAKAIWEGYNAPEILTRNSELLANLSKKYSWESLAGDLNANYATLVQ